MNKAVNFDSLVLILLRDAVRDCIKSFTVMSISLCSDKAFAYAFG